VHTKANCAAHDKEVGNRMAYEFGSQALTISHVFVEQRCLTPAFTGPPNGIASNYENRAAAAPVQRLVGRTLAAVRPSPLL
jgi:hypothetical protein